MQTVVVRSIFMWWPEMIPYVHDVVNTVLSYL